MTLIKQKHMAKASIGLGIKTFSLLLASLVLSGCYKIEIKETIQNC